MEQIEQSKSFYAHADKDGRIFNRRVCLLQTGAKVPGHTCIGSNRVLDFYGYFNIRDLVRLVEPEVYDCFWMILSQEKILEQCSRPAQAVRGRLS